MTLRKNCKVYRPCMRCGEMYEKLTKRMKVCPKCRKLAWKHSGETRRKQRLTSAVPESFKWFAVRKAPQFEIPKIGPLNPIK